MKILTYFEVKDGEIKKASFETASKAAEIAEKLNGEACALFVGENISEEMAKSPSRVNIKKSYILKNESLKTFSNSIYASAISNFAKEREFDAILFPATSTGKDLAPIVSAYFDVPYISDVIKVDVVNGDVTFVKPIFSGKAMKKISVEENCFVASLRVNVFPVIEKHCETLVESVEAKLDDVKSSKVTGYEKGSSELLDVAEADIIISGGRGMKGPENFEMLAEVAKLFGGAMGASRAAVDAGWVPHSHQVGQTGKVVSPSLYIACGISGAIQHLAGMSSSKVIVAINKDKDAPIFNVATYGIVGDLFEIVPLLKEEIKSLKG
jgi:electron transfer flavoprotein alpha subunit